VRTKSSFVGETVATVRLVTQSRALRKCQGSWTEAKEQAFIPWCRSPRMQLGCRLGGNPSLTIRRHPLASAGTGEVGRHLLWNMRGDSAQSDINLHHERRGPWAVSCQLSRSALDLLLIRGLRRNKLSQEPDDWNLACEKVAGNQDVMRTPEHRE